MKNQSKVKQTKRKFQRRNRSSCSTSQMEVGAATSTSLSPRLAKSLQNSSKTFNLSLTSLLLFTMYEVGRPEQIIVKYLQRVPYYAVKLLQDLIAFLKIWSTRQRSVDAPFYMLKNTVENSVLVLLLHKKKLDFFLFRIYRIAYVVADGGTSCYSVRSYQ